jgi:hypothetical protein
MAWTMVRVPLVLPLLPLLFHCASVRPVAADTGAAAEEEAQHEIYRELSKAFDTLSFEGDGKLERSSFSQLIFDMGVSVTRSVLDDIFDEIDSPDGEGKGNDDGGVSPLEMSTWWDVVSQCSRHNGCGSCTLAQKCAWCIAEGKCVNDEPYMCAGPEDHVGRNGTAAGCP